MTSTSATTMRPARHNSLGRSHSQQGKRSTPSLLCLERLSRASGASRIARRRQEVLLIDDLETYGEAGGLARDPMRRRWLATVSFVHRSSSREAAVARASRPGRSPSPGHRRRAAASARPRQPPKRAVEIGEDKGARG
jgi:hypothetical protein